jgi:hypothetical protein
MLFFHMSCSGPDLPKGFPKVGLGGQIFQKDLSVGMFFLSSRYFWQKADEYQAEKRARNQPVSGRRPGTQPPFFTKSRIDCMIRFLFSESPVIPTFDF